MKKNCGHGDNRIRDLATYLTGPAGYVSGLPVGLSFFAGAYQEGNLIHYAYAFEQATQVRRPPGFSATVGLNGRVSGP